MNTQDIVLTALPGKGRTGRLEVISPFAEVLPAKLPKLRLAYDEEALIERSIGAQLHHILPVDSTHGQAVLEQLQILPLHSVIIWMNMFVSIRSVKLL